MSRQTTKRLRGEGGFSLAEVMVATGIMAAGLVTLASLFGASTRSNIGSRNTTYATVLAEQKLEELRGLTYGFDTIGLPMTDTTSDTASNPEKATGGTGLQPSPSTALQEDTDGYVDHIDQTGKKLGGGQEAPAGTVYTRRWSIEALPTNPNNVLVIQVLVTRVADRGAANQGAVQRLPEESRMVTVKTRKAK